MDYQKIKIALASEPHFRFEQAKKAIFTDTVESWNKVSNFPKELREKLSKTCPLNQDLRPVKAFYSKDGQVMKVLFRLKDGFNVESVLMKHKDGRRTVCISSQVGCAIGCKFCTTGHQGFTRNLYPGEIIDQVLYFSRILKKSGEKVSNVVFMGMGEPFLNYNNVIDAVRILNDNDGFKLASRKISISTSGIPEGIERLAQENLQINLALSLHAPNNKLRSELMPINNHYPIENILKSVYYFIKKTKRRVMFEYLMIDGINDKEEHAVELSKLMKKPLYFVNLISYNPSGHEDFKPSSGKTIKNFKNILTKNRIPVTQRYRFGGNIKAGCGQLAGKE